jgi:hypothetical protein
MPEFPAVHVGFDQGLGIASEYLAQLCHGSQVSVFRGSTSATVAQRMGNAMQVPGESAQLGNSTLEGEEFLFRQGTEASEMRSD